jgi:solute carrier family 6 amino acid transporter-like protein 5/7/9/14
MGCCSKTEDHAVEKSEDGLEEEDNERGNWTGKLDFILSCIGFAVGLGNVWRFPYLCYANGGGAFLIPYSLMLALAGLPLFFMELSFGQFASLGPISIWRISPMFKGLGYAMITVSGLVCIYYNVIMAYTIFFFFASFGKDVPWKHCGNKWNTDACREIWGGGHTNMTGMNATNFTGSPKSPADEYFHRYVLDISSGIEHLGEMRWQMVLCLLFAWIAVFFCLIKGVKSSGKVVYFTATFPYVVLTILLIRGLTLEGSLDGVKFYIIPDFSRLSDSKVWGDAAVQIFYSLGPAWGGLITMSSFNKFHNNCYRDAVLVAIINCGTSVYAGFVIFSVVGYMAHALNVPIANATSSGPGLAFIAYPEGLAGMPIAPLWALLFFFMLWTLGIDSQMVMMETVISGLYDEFKVFRGRKVWLTLGLCIIFFLLGLPQCMQGGMYVMHLFNWYSAGFSLLLIGLFENLVVMHIYGYHRFADDIKHMIGFKPNIYWYLTWMLLTPMAIIFIIIFMGISHVNISYNDVDFPDVADLVGWLMVVVAVVWIPLFMVWEVIKEWRKNGFVGFWDLLGRASSPTSDWGPALKKHRLECNYPVTDGDPQFQDISKPSTFGVEDLSNPQKNGHLNSSFEVEHDQKM